MAEDIEDPVRHGKRHDADTGGRGRYRSKIAGVKYASANVKCRTGFESSGQRDFTQVIGADVEYPKVMAGAWPREVLQV